MRAVVTGAAGFMGSHLCDRLLADGHDVLGIDCFRDCFRDYRYRALKAGNLAKARTAPRFSFRHVDLVADDLRPVFEGADVVYHFAGRSGHGVWSGKEFGEYVANNVPATERLLEALVTLPVKKLVYAGSSAVYGDTEMLPTKESAMPRPRSTYGVTKLAGENLVLLYMRNFGLPATILRFFTVYGPRQRPDMAISRFMDALAQGTEIEIRGDGEQTRDFTHVDDAVEATILSTDRDVAGDVINIGGGSRSSLNAILARLEEISGMEARRRYLPPEAADQRHAAASINRARQRLGWEPRVALRDGLASQWAWFQGLTAREWPVGLQVATA
jgi:nucleoside-diphosphate-sugar epimerase